MEEKGLRAVNTRSEGPLFVSGKKGGGAALWAKLDLFPGVGDSVFTKEQQLGKAYMLPVPVRYILRQTVTSKIDLKKLSPVILQIN
jgi:hypothetical protein